MKKTDQAAIRLFVSRKISLVCTAMCCFGFVASAAHAQDKLSLPDLLKGAMQRPGGTAPSAPSGAEATPKGMGLEQPNTASAPPRSGEAAGSPAGEGGTIAFPGRTLKGSFVHEPGNSAQKSAVVGKYYGRGDDGAFSISTYDENASRQLQVDLQSVLPDLMKTPRTYSFKQRKKGGVPPFAEMHFQVPRIVCTAISGALIITAFGPVDGFVTGTLKDIVWDSSDCNDPKVLGTSATFKIQRSADTQH